jgi:hypothetical protein
MNNSEAAQAKDKWRWLKIGQRGPGVVLNTYNPGTQEAEAGDWKLEASLDYMARFCLRKEKKKGQSIL